MSSRSRLEDEFTVKCANCGFETINPFKEDGQIYATEKCMKCKYDPDAGDIDEDIVED